MENTKNISSEQELLELLNEGKINEDEYHDLLGTLQRRPHAESGNVAPAGVEPARTSGLAIVSIVLALALGPFGVLPAIICGHVALRKIERDPSLTGRALALAGLIAGYSILGLTIVISVPILLPLLAYQRAEISRPLSADVVVLRQYALNDTQGLITQSGIGIDKQISSDGNGSLRIEAAEPTTIRLFETGEMDIENARLIYQARVRTENVVGQVYLEMWCHFPVGGEFFSRGLVSSLTGTTDWTTLETPFMLKKGQEPDNVKLNLVINGHGTVWIDDIRLLKGPFE
jgi:F0F1-type ATP synthase membrane subunit c/vacuolar-type H+-ATPase subunit K